jgi:FAD/FMN-containing dehydrogenase
MPVAFTGDVDALRGSFGGTVVMPGDASYDESRSLWNGQIDRRPAIIARCSSAADVAGAIRFARENGLEISVRGGGHNYSGSAVGDGAMMIHLGDMKDVTVDPASMRARCGGGATWADVDAATQEHGLAVPGGFISHTGVGGLTLGGGVGWLTKLGGLSCDNLVGAEVVTADSRVLHASASENSDLFWALRGGGGNFGVVTTFEFSLHNVGPMVNVALLFWGLDDGAAALKLMRDVILTLPDSATGFIAAGLSAPPAPFVPEQYHFAPGYALVIVGFSSPEAHAELVAPVREKLPPLFELVTPIPFAGLQQMFNESSPWGLFAYEKALYLDELSDGAIATITEHSPKKSSPLSFVPMFVMTGAYSTVGENDTAFGGSRSARYIMNIAGHVPEAAGYEAERAWVRDFWSAMQPFAMGSGGYINFQAEEDPDRVRATYGPEKFDRLARIKAKYDPDNVFHFNANIQPAS